jgi:protocatechuate 3,4-dioxygenase beta subunit
MQRRTFIKDTALFAVAISASGFIRFDGNSYVGDCETTTDILGPFYRPDSPVRNNLVIKGEQGTVVELSGIIKRADCITPHQKAKVELWHCSSDGVYDNDSDKYLYRGTTFCDAKGHYLFKTILPVPYDAGGAIRPAHYHLMITAEGYQPLVTQLYFSGDPHIVKDTSASSVTAKRRILELQTLKDGTKRVLFNVSMSDVLAAEPASIEKLTGVYTDVKDQARKAEFFKRDNALWLKNPVFGVNLAYIGNNTFQYPGTPPGMHWTFRFEILASGSVKLTQKDNYPNDNGQEVISEWIKDS